MYKVKHVILIIASTTVRVDVAVCKIIEHLLTSDSCFEAHGCVKYFDKSTGIKPACW